PGLDRLVPLGIDLRPVRDGHPGLRGRLRYAAATGGSVRALYAAVRREQLRHWRILSDWIDLGDLVRRSRRPALRGKSLASEHRRRSSPGAAARRASSRQGLESARPLGLVLWPRALEAQSVDVRADRVLDALSAGRHARDVAEHRQAILRNAGRWRRGRGR